MLEAVAYPIIEADLVAFFNAQSAQLGWDAACYTQVPATRPARFLTVQRTGGEVNPVFTDTPIVAVDAWASSAYDAAVLGTQARAQVYLMPAQIATVNRALLQSFYNYPDPASDQARYQFVIEITTKGAVT